jgi:peptidoglycan/xylan/chitin deacetylase (PgdA/CDA1 family)
MRFPILTFHQIAPTPPKGTPYRSLCVAPESFAKHMRWLKTLGYQGVSMSGLLPYLQGVKQGRVVGITFDDGYLNNLTHALPVLQELGFSATCYAVSQLLGKTNVWDEAVGIPQVPLMNAAQLRAWVDGGQEVGAHTRHHVHLPDLSPDVAQQEIAQCKAELQDITGQAVEHFCYPYGDYSPEHVRMVQEAGYATATTTQRGRAQVGDNLFELRRVPVLRRASRLQLLLKLATHYEDRKT